LKHIYLFSISKIYYANVLARYRDMVKKRRRAVKFVAKQPIE